MSLTVLVLITQTYRPWTPRQRLDELLTKKFDAKARLTEISVNDLIVHWQLNAILYFGCTSRTYRALQRPKFNEQFVKTIRWYVKES